MERATMIVGGVALYKSLKGRYSPCRNCTNEGMDKEECGGEDCAHSDVLDKLAAYEDIGTVEEFAEYRREREAGLTVELPEKFKDLCNALGDSVYHLMADEEVTESLLCGVDFACDGTIDLIFVSEEDRWEVPISTFGKTVFLTREAAEAALQEKTNE